MIENRQAELDRDLARDQMEREDERDEEVKGVKSMVRRRGDDDGMEGDESDNDKVKEEDNEDVVENADKKESHVEVRLEGEDEDEEKEGEMEIKLE